MVTRLLKVTLLSMASTLAFSQASKAPDTSAGPVPPAIQQMPNRFQPPVPGCTDCYYTVPSGKVVGAMGRTNNEGIKVTHPIAAPAAVTASNDLIFKSGAGVWAFRSPVPLPLFIGSAVGLSHSPSASLTLTSACNLQSVDYTTDGGMLTTVSIPLSLWDVTTRTKLVDLPTNWNSWKTVVYPPVKVDKLVPAGHKLQVRVTQPAFSKLPPNFQFNINVSAHCLKETRGAESASPAAPKPKRAPSPGKK